MPVQTPRIPIWVGGSAQRKGPVRRVARWDGVVPVPIRTSNGGRHLTAAEVRHLRQAIESRRTERRPFDVALGGLERGPDWEEERAHILAAKGAIMRVAIERGPLRIN